MRERYNIVIGERKSMMDPIYATREGLLFAWGLGFVNIHLEGDAKQLHDRLQDQVAGG